VAQGAQVGRRRLRVLQDLAIEARDGSKERGARLFDEARPECWILLARVDDRGGSDGTTVQSPIRRPHTVYLSEAFKIRDHAIEQIEANFITVPYHMQSPWDARR
jgi:hypothetical protein